MKVWYFDIDDFELKIGHVFNFYESIETKLFHHQCVVMDIIPSQKTKTHLDTSQLQQRNINS